MDLAKAEQLARDLIKEHKIDFSFNWIRSNNYLGRCNYRKKEIQLSKSITELNCEEIIEDTIKHEIAHAIAGVGHGHNFYWKQIAVSIGCKPNRLASEFTIIPYKYDLVCPTCGIKYGFNKRSYRNYTCNKCKTIVGYNNYIKR